MLLKNLIKNKNFGNNLKIKGISFDSRNVKKGDLFVSIKGNKLDGKDFVEQAISKGAKVIVYSKFIKKNKKSLFIKVKDTREFLAKISCQYYNNKPKNILAVTGTNGKTSVCDFFHQILLHQNKKVGFIGTLGSKKNKILKKRKLTTLDSLTLNKDLDEMKKGGIDNVIVEASSHGLEQKRLKFIKLKAGIFTNLSHDHLDYHGNMSKYLNAKLLLFKNNLNKKSHIITDTDIKEYSKIKKIQRNRKIKISTIGSKGNVFKVINYKIDKNFQTLKILYKNKVYKLKINLFGSIQLKNLLMAILAANICGLKIESIFAKISKIKNVDGRLELVRTLPNKSKVFIDYAHTPEALKNAIESLREHFQKKITIIFGCGGERDKSKRKLMGTIAKKYCDKIYVTDDNPRSESPKKIRKDIIKGLKNSNVIEIGNRKKAIHSSIKNSSPNEIILIAGKGHETYQDFGSKKIFFSDRKVVKKIKLKAIKKQENNLKFNSYCINKIFKNKDKYLFDGVSINSKEIKYNDLFVAIKGKKKDGHNFINEALKKGASFCVVSNKKIKGKKIIYVKNTLNFLQKLAKIKRDRSSTKFIAVTGSSGKTTVKTMLGNLLKNYSSSYFSPRSFNNQFGVPLSICNLKVSDNYGVFEVGMNRFNEINRLSSIVKPSIGIITNISEAHLQNFKNIQEIAKAKSEIIYNIKKGGTLILNKDDSFFEYHKNIAIKNRLKVRSFGFKKGSDIRFVSIQKKDPNFLLNLRINTKKLILKVNNPNLNYIMNALCCIAVLDELNLNFNKIYNFFKFSKLLSGRGKISEVKKMNKKFYLIDESYNANPSSVKSAIENFSNIKKKGRKKYFLFGDMLELGKKSGFYHKKISKIINKSDIDKTYVYGKKVIETYKLLKKNKKGQIINDLNKFENKIFKILKSGDYLMIKGSNATKLYQVSKNLLKGSYAL